MVPFCTARLKYSSDRLRIRGLRFQKDSEIDGLGDSRAIIAYSDKKKQCWGRNAITSTACSRPSIFGGHNVTIGRHRRGASTLRSAQDMFWTHLYPSQTQIRCLG